MSIAAESGGKPASQGGLALTSAARCKILPNKSNEFNKLG
jgi:hypothetical protein